jgi:hypothetical protein
VAAVFTGNDPTGTLLAWRGWSISDRIAGRNESLQLPDLPVYRRWGAIPWQHRTIHPFREVDGRLGYYAGASVNVGARQELAALRYDRFSTTEHDNLPGDPNNETGHGVALAYNWPLSRSLAVMTEWLEVQSERPSRVLVRERPDQTERSFTASLRWRF